MSCEKGLIYVVFFFDHEEIIVVGMEDEF